MLPDKQIEIVIMIVVAKIARRAGEILFSIGILHILSGLILYPASLNEIIQAGFVDTVDHNIEWFGFFWYGISGCFLVMYGLMAAQYIAQQRRCLPSIHGYLLLIVSLFGIVLEPLSGFYLFVPVAVSIAMKGNQSISPKTSP